MKRQQVALSAHRTVPVPEVRHWPSLANASQHARQVHGLPKRSSEDDIWLTVESYIACDEFWRKGENGRTEWHLHWQIKQNGDSVASS
jgi:hypothetical protein